MNKTKSTILIFSILFIVINTYNILAQSLNMGVTCVVVAGEGTCPNIASQSSINDLSKKVAQETSLKKLITKMETLITNVGGSKKDSIHDALDNIYDDLETMIDSNDAEQRAKNNTMIQMSKIGKAALDTYQNTKDSSTNINTDGANFAKNINTYLNKISINEIKKTLDPNNLPDNAYTTDIKKNIIKEYRSSTDETLSTLPLPFIAQKEICGSTKLKDVIENGEPSTWINPKPALKNVDIDELCNANLTKKEATSDESDEFGISKWNLPLKKGMESENVKKLKEFLYLKGYLKSQSNGNTFDSSTQDAVKSFQKDQGLDQTGEVDDMTQVAMISVEGQKKEITGKSAQAAWISIANAGYGGPLTRAALADPINSPSGQQSLIQEKINKNKSTAIENAKSEYLANNGIIADTTCINKNGDVVNFDPTNQNIESSYCFDYIATSTESSAFAKANNIRIAQELLTSNLLQIKATTQTGDSEEKTNSNKTGYEDVLGALINKPASESCDKKVSEAIQDIEKQNVSTVSKKIKSKVSSLGIGTFAGNVSANLLGGSVGQIADKTIKSSTDKLVDKMIDKSIKDITAAAKKYTCSVTKEAKIKAKEELDNATKNAKNSLGQIVKSQSKNESLNNSLQKEINSTIDKANKDITSQINNSTTTKSVNQQNYTDLAKYLDTLMKVK